MMNERGVGSKQKQTVRRAKSPGEDPAAKYFTLRSTLISPPPPAIQRQPGSPAPLVWTPHPSHSASLVEEAASRTSPPGAVFSDMCGLCAAAAECSSYKMVQPSMKSPLFSFKGLTWIFNDELISFICQIYSMTPFFSGRV